MTHEKQQKIIWFLLVLHWAMNVILWLLLHTRPNVKIKEDTVEPSVPAGEFNLKAYAAIIWHNDPASLGLEPRLADHRSQAARTTMLPIASPGQASSYLVNSKS